MTDSRYVPAAGRGGLTRFYDAGVRLTMRERLWRPMVVEQVVSNGPAVVLDLGCGTGSLAIPIAQRVQAARVIGLDGDAEVLDIAQSKPGGERVEWIEGFADEVPLDDGTVDSVVTSLLLHHLPLPTKLAALSEARRVLRPGGQLVLADWAKPQDPVMSAAFLGLQLLDGFGTTGDNRDGMIPRLIVDAGFGEPSRLRRIRTVLGTFEVLLAAPAP
ncbi:MAG TPA: methyltransferase domain-containing protein [Aeromicrobium sp.]|nr:methyltransferase domain-containing protein [Aeromicrobium sp.]